MSKKGYKHTLSQGLEVFQFLYLSDNYGFILRDSVNGKTILVDAGDFTFIDNFLQSHSLSLDEIWVTHHHIDHTEGCIALRDKYSCKIYAPSSESSKISFLDEGLREGDMLNIGKHNFSILSLPGHTLGHIGYYSSSCGLLFCGDALFILGCGRMFEGDASSMWSGLRRLRDLPDETKFYCGHEYSVSNANFALSIDSSNKELSSYRDELISLSNRGEFCVPGILGKEKICNPFFRVDTGAIQRGLSFFSDDASEVFAVLRLAKDNYRG